jgi:hypothetical protein
MALSDPFMMRMLHPTELARYVVDGALVVILIAAGLVISKHKRPC